MTNDAAKEEAKRENVFHLVCIGAKERIAKDIINRAGTNITNPRPLPHGQGQVQEGGRVLTPSTHQPRDVER